MKPPNTRCPRCGELNSRLDYDFQDGQLMTWCCGEMPVAEDGRELTEDAIDAIFAAQAEDVAYDRGMGWII